MKKLLLVLLLIANYCLTKSQDRVFTYTYQSNVLSSNQKEIEVWTTLSNKKDVYYKNLKQKIEFETGILKNLQTAFYLSYQYTTKVVQNDSIQVFSENEGISFSNEWKYKLSDPVANIVGSAIYLEYTISTSETNFEGKLIFDKQFGKIITALNIVDEYSIIKEFSKNGNNINLNTIRENNNEIVYALAYKINKKVYLGAESFNSFQIKKSKINNSILYAGPSFSYSTDGYWINLSLLSRITNYTNNKTDLNKNELFKFRLLFSFNI